MNNPLVSIVMVNYNHEDFLRDSIESVLQQTYPNWELILVDDGSTDKSVDIIKSYDDVRIKPIFLSKNSHICIATNRGLEKVNGELVARLDSDDIWRKDKLEKQVKFFDEHPDANVSFTKLDIIDETNTVVNDKIKDLYDLYNHRQKDQKDWLRFFFFVGNSLIQSTMMYRKSALDKVGYFNLAYVQAHDLDFFVRLSKHYTFDFIEEPLCRYRRIENQNSSIDPEKEMRFFNEHMNIRAHYFDDMDDELFIHAFGEYFVNVNSHTENELKCEKAFLLSKCIGYSNKNPILGMFVLEKYLNDKKMFNLLEEKFDFAPKDYYEMNKNVQMVGERNYEEKIQNLNNRIKTLEEENKHQKNHISALLELKENQQILIDDMTNSMSWKITKPLRKINNTFKNKY